jgi:hypothetical protein
VQKSNPEGYRPGMDEVGRLMIVETQGEYNCQADARHCEQTTRRESLAASRDHGTHQMRSSDAYERMIKDMLWWTSALEGCF